MSENTQETSDETESAYTRQSQSPSSSCLYCRCCFTGVVQSVSHLCAKCLQNGTALKPSSPKQNVGTNTISSSNAAGPSSSSSCSAPPPLSPPKTCSTSYQQQPILSGGSNSNVFSCLPLCSTADITSRSSEAKVSCGDTERDLQLWDDVEKCLDVISTIKQDIEALNFIMLESNNNNNNNNESESGAGVGRGSVKRGRDVNEEIEEALTLLHDVAEEGNNKEVVGGEAEGLLEPPAPKKTKNRCGECNVRVGLMGFECRCGGIFCAVHRYSDIHKCSFDYLEEGKSSIRKSNPQVAGNKVHKI